MPTRPTPRPARRSAAPARPARRSAAPAALVAGLALLLCGLAPAAAPPASAVEDLGRPDATVLQGPSCRPGGVAVQVVAGSVGYAVTLATTRRPDGEDTAELRPGETAVLRTGDVASGETIDSRLEYTALDGSGDHYVDDLEPYTFTRPAADDCAAITAGPAAPAVDEPPPGPVDLPPAGGATDPSTRPDAPAGGSPVAVRTTAAERAPDGPWAPLAAVLALAGGAAGLVAGRRRRRSARGSRAGA